MYVKFDKIMGLRLIFRINLLSHGHAHMLKKRKLEINFITL